MTDNLISDLTEEQRQLLALRLRRTAKAPADGPLPLSFTQEQLWFLDRLDPGNAAYTVPFGLRLTGPLDRPVLDRAIAGVVDRHSALRTTFVEHDGELRQRVHDRVDVAVEVTDLTGLAPDEREAAARQVAVAHAQHGFDLAAGPLLAVRLVVLAPTEHLLLVTAHHIVFDAASAEVFTGDLIALYGGRELPALGASYGKHAAAQRARLTGAVLDGHLDYWRDKLAGSPALSTLPPDRQRPPTQSHRGGRHAFTVSADLTAALVQRARLTGVTLNALVLTGFAALIRQATGQDRVLLGMPVGGRDRTELEPLIGSFANMLVLRVDLADDDTVADAVRRTHRTISEAHVNQDAPYARVVEVVDPPRDPSHNPLFQAMLSITDATESARVAGGVEFRAVEVDSGQTDFDLFVVLSRVDGELRGEVGFNADLYLDETISQAAERFLAVLEAIAADVEQPVGAVPALRGHRVGVVSSFTAGPLRDPLDLLTRVLRTSVDLDLAPYHQVVQHLMGGDPDGKLADVVLLRWEDWLRHAEPDPAALEDVWRDLEAAIEANRARSGAPLVIVVCPASPGFGGPDWAPVLGRLDDRLAVLGDRLDGVRALWFADWAERYPVGTVFDEQTDKLGHIPYTPEMFAALAILVARELHRLAGGDADRLDALGLTVPVTVVERATPARRLAVGDTPLVAPRTETERRLAGLWRDLLNLDEVGVTHDFFAMGGHSLLATQLLSRVHAEFGSDIAVHALFTHPTIEALAGLVDEPAEQERPIRPVSRDGDLQPSLLQQRLWAVGQLDGDPTRHNTTFAAVLKGELDVDAVRSALARVVARHEILRTTFAERSGRPVMVVRPELDCRLEPLDIRDEPEAVERHILATAEHHYDLASGPLLRVQVLRTGDAEYHLVLGMHHIICDNTSWGVLLGELSAGYEGRGGLPELEIQFADYAAWQHDLLAEAGPQIDYWRDRLRGAKSVLGPAAERTPAGTRTERAEARVGRDAAAALRDLAMAEGVTPSVALFAAWAVRLYRRGGESDVLVSVPQTGRGRPELEPLIGCFTDLLPVRVDLAGRPTFRQVVHRVHRAVVEGYQHLQVPFSSLVEALNLPKTRGRHPIFQCAFNLADLPDEALSWGGMDLVPIDVPVTGVDFDLFLNLSWEAGELAVSVEYSGDLFDQAEADMLLAEFVAAVGDLVDDPDQPIADTERPAESADTALVAATWSAEPARPVLDWWTAKLDLPVSVRFGPPGQVLRPLLDPAGGSTVLLIRWEDLLPAAARRADVAALQDWLTRFCRTLDRSRGQSSAPLTVLVARATDRFAAAPWPGVFGHATDRLRRFADGYADVEVLDLASVGGDQDVVIGTALARALHSHCASPVRTVLVDPTRFPETDLAAFARRQTRLGRRVLLIGPPSAEVRALSGAEAVEPSLLSEVDRVGLVAVNPDSAVLAVLPEALVVTVDDRESLAHLWPLDARTQGSGTHALSADLAAETARLRTADDVRAAISGVSTDAGSVVAPRTDDERALAAIWQDVLRVPELGVHDDFFALGGDSMTAIQVVWLANQAGLAITPAHLKANPTVAGLCALSAQAPVAAEQGLVDGEFPITGAQHWFFDTLAPTMAAPEHFSHPYYLQLREPVPVDRLAAAVRALAEHHDVLRTRLRRTDSGWVATHAAVADAVPFETHDISDLPEADRERAVLDLVNRAHLGFDLETGPLARVVHIGLGAGSPDRVMVLCHHLVTDGVSRSLLLEDFQTVLRQLGRGEQPALPAKTTSYRDWARKLAEYARGDCLAQELPFWAAQAPGQETLPVDLPGENRFGLIDTMSRDLDAETTDAVRAVAKANGIGMGDVLAWAAVRLAADWTGSPEWTIATTGHGRETLFDDVDLARTLGWFQVLYPVRLRLPDGADDLAAAVEVATQLARVPRGGIGYGLLRAHPDPQVRERLSTAAPQLTVNYVGAFGFDDVSVADDLFDLCGADLGVVQDPGGIWCGRIDVAGSLIGDRLRLEMNFGTEIHHRDTVERLLGELEGLLQRLATRKG